MDTNKTAMLIEEGTLAECRAAKYSENIDWTAFAGGSWREDMINN